MHISWYSNIIETFYNTVRTHSHCGYLSPDQYEEEYYAALDKRAEAGMS